MHAKKLAWSFLLIAVFLTLTTTGWAQQCSLATLKGPYTALEQGTLTQPLLPPGVPFLPFVLTARATFDGAGNLSGTFAENEFPEAISGTFSGTYKVTSDCAYSDIFTVIHPGETHVLHHTGYISGQGILQEIRTIYTDSGLVVSGTLKKQW